MLLAGSRALISTSQRSWAVAVGLRGLSSHDRGNEVDELNRELADVFGVPFAPEGTCLASSAEGAVDGSGWPAGSVPIAPISQEAPPAQVPGKQQMPTWVVEEFRRLDAQMKHLMRQEQSHRNLGMAALDMQHQPSSSATAAAAQPYELQELQQELWDTAGSSAAPSVPNSQAAAAAAAVSQSQQEPWQQLSHVDNTGRASMVDVAGKASSARVAAASCRVLLGEAAYRAVAANAIAKGDVLRVAQIAGIQGAKATAQLIPLCHNIFISSVDVNLQLDESRYAVDITATARTSGQTGVEMEALTGAAVAALTVYDMTKAVSKGIQITELQLVYKEGGKSGTWHREHS